MIDSYKFGEIVINRKTYTNDVIIFPGHVKSDWWRKEGHLLQSEDLKDVFEAKPEKLIIGTGYNGLMKVSEDVFSKANELGIELIVKKSEDACKLYNIEKNNTVIALHLTC